MKRKILSGLAACRTLVVDSEKRPRRGQFLPDLQPHSPAMGQKTGEKWTAAVALQPTIPKSDRLLVRVAMLGAAASANAFLFSSTSDLNGTGMSVSGLNSGPAGFTISMQLVAGDNIGVAFIGAAHDLYATGAMATTVMPTTIPTRKTDRRDCVRENARR